MMAQKQGPQPSGSPNAQGQEKSGLKAHAQTNIHIALNMLEEALPAYGAESKEGRIIMAALTKLGTLAAKRDSSDLVPAEVMAMVGRMPQMGGGTDAQRMILQQIQQGRQAQQQPPQQQQQPGA